MFFNFSDFIAVESWATGFQDPAYNWMYNTIDSYDKISFYLSINLVVIIWFFLSSVLSPG